MTDKKIQIIQTSKKLFLEKGYDKASVQHIINSLGISKGGFYHYFTSKEEVLDAIVYEEFGELIEQVKKIFEDKNLNSLEKINKWLETKTEFIKNKFELVQCVFGDDKHIQLRTLALKKLREQIYPYIENNINEGVKSGIFNFQNPEQVINIILSIHDHIFSCSEKHIKDKNELEKYNQAIKEIFNKLFI